MNKAQRKKLWESGSVSGKPLDPKAIRKSIDYSCFGINENQSTAPVSLIFMQKNGQEKGFFYGNIISPIVISENTTIQIHTATGHVIIIEGRNLSSLYYYLCERRVMWIKVITTEISDIPDEEPEVERIYIGSEEEFSEEKENE